MSLMIKRIVNVQINEQGILAKNRDLSTIAVLSDEWCEAFNDEKTRYISVQSATDGAKYFGSESNTAKALRSIFAVNGVKKAIIAKWVREDKTIEATPNELRGSTISYSARELSEIKDGSFKIILGGKEEEFSGIDFSTATDYASVAKILSTALTAKNVKAIFDTDGQRFKLQAVKSGKDDKTTFGFMKKASLGTFIGGFLNLVDGKADIYYGVDASTQSKETIRQALDKLFNATQGFYGVYSSGVLSDDEILALDSWITSAPIPMVAGFTVIKNSHLENDKSNPIKKIANKNSGRFFATYNNTADEHAGAELLSMALSTNWEGSFTAQTMKFKNLKTAQTDEGVDLNIAEKCDSLGINYYTDYDGVSLVAEGVALGGKFIDEVVGLDAFSNRVQIGTFNVLKGARKVPQTDKGQVRLIAVVKQVCEQFVNNGFIAPGQWRGDPVGELESGDYLDLGYYVYSPSYNTQLQTDREARKAVPINVAIKLSGAIHSLDVIVNFNR
jgi:similar to unknown bacteriophage protein|nr:MAG TPA: tail sheath protein [Caudoviricetes sp.]